MNYCLPWMLIVVNDHLNGGSLMNASIILRVSESNSGSRINPPDHLMVFHLSSWNRSQTRQIKKIAQERFPAGGKVLQLWEALMYTNEHENHWHLSIFRKWAKAFLNSQEIGKESRKLKRRICVSEFIKHDPSPKWEPSPRGFSYWALKFYDKTWICIT